MIKGRTNLKAQRHGGWKANLIKRLFIIASGLFMVACGGPTTVAFENRSNKRLNIQVDGFHLNVSPGVMPPADGVRDVTARFTTRSHIRVADKITINWTENNATNRIQKVLNRADFDIKKTLPRGTLWFVFTEQESWEIKRE